MVKRKKCDECEKEFRNLSKHKLTHTGEKPFKCDFKNCDYACITSENLSRHKLTHTGEKPFKCDLAECDYACTQSSNLKQHKLIHTGEKPHKCDFNECNYACTTLQAVKQHKLTHTGEKPHKCDFKNCDYACITSENLSRHKLTHTGEKPHKCDFKNCDYACTTSWHLATHKLIHTGEYKYFCGECGWLFRQAASLNSHIERIHSGKINNYEKKEEKAIIELLKNAGIPFDYNISIEFCGLAENKKRAFPDFVMQSEHGILILEIDEHGHGTTNLQPDEKADDEIKCESDSWGYSVSCEQERMLNIVASLRANQELVPIAFVRYNPHAFKKNSCNKQISKEERETQLLQFIQEWLKAPSELDFAIYYHCYNTYTIGNAERCEVWDHKDFSEQLQDCVFIV